MSISPIGGHPEDSSLYYLEVRVIREVKISRELQAGGREGGHICDLAGQSRPLLASQQRSPAFPSHASPCLPLPIDPPTSALFHDFVSQIQRSKVERAQFPSEWALKSPNGPLASLFRGFKLSRHFVNWPIRVRCLRSSGDTDIEVTLPT